MDDYQSLSTPKWECKYHVVFIAQYRRKTLYVELRRHLGMCSENWPSRRKAGSRRGIFYRTIMLIWIPPKYAVSQVIGFIKGKRAIHLARAYGEKKRHIRADKYPALGPNRQQKVTARSIPGRRWLLAFDLRNPANQPQHGDP
jgi:putative transposase